jgi:hypothetical protein
MFNNLPTREVGALLMFLILSLSTGQVNSQTVFEDDFETFTPGVRLVCQDSINWDTWSSIPCDTVEDPYVSRNVAFSGVNSVWIQQGRDLIKPIPDYANGKYRISFHLYIPSGFTAGWGQLADFLGTAPDSNRWGFYARFNPSGYGTINADKWDAAQFSFSYDTWMLNELIVDLNNDWAEFYFEANMIYGWQWTSSSDSTCPLQLSVTDIMGSIYPNTGPSEWYVDDYVLEQLDPNVGLGHSVYAPTEFILKQNYPNPFNPSTTIKYELPKSTNVRLSMFDMLGREVSVLVNEKRDAGVHEVTFDAPGFSSGVYFYRIRAGDFVQSKKLLILK